MVDRENLIEILQRGLKAIGYELVDFDFVREQTGWILRVFIDHPFVGPTLEPPDERPRISLGDCQQASRHLGTVLDVADPIKQAYRLELSSPGLKRRLRKKDDFERFVGFEVAIKMETPIDGRRAFAGQLAGVVGEELVVEVDGTTVSLPLSGVSRAQLAEEY